MNQNNITEEETSCWYFDTFIKESLKDLKSKRETIVFNKEHINKIKKIYPSMNISQTIDGFYKITIDNL